MTAIFNRRASLTLAALATFGLAGTAAQAQSVFTSWTFETPNTAGATSLSPTTAVGTGTAASLGMTNTFNGTASTDASNILVSPGTSTSTGTTNPTDQSWRVVGSNGWSSNAPQYSQGAQFLTSTLGETNVSVTFDWNPTKQGAGDLELQYTTDGTTFKNAAVFSAETGINGVTGTAFYNGLTYNFGSLANNDANFGVRMVNAFTGAAEVSTQGTALNNTSGNWRFDNVNFSGTPASTNPVPEASTTVSLGLLLALGLGGLALARKKSANA